MTSWATRFEADFEVPADMNRATALDMVLELLADAAHEVLDAHDPAVALDGTHATIEFVVDAESQHEAIVIASHLLSQVMTKAGGDSPRIDVSRFNRGAHVAFVAA